MLNLMRKHAGSWLIKTVLAAIVIVFVFWGVGTFKEGNTGRVAAVNDEVISAEEYREAYNRLVERYRSQFGGRLDADMIKLLRLESRALQALIDERLMFGEIERLGLKVSNEAVRNSITGIQAFHKDGGFDAERYRSLLQRFGMKPEGFEASQRKSLALDMLKDVITAGAKVSDAEVREWYDWSNTEVSLDYAFFEPSKYVKVKIDDSGLRERYQTDRNDYKTVPEVKVKYFNFRPEDYEKDVAITDQQVKERYEAGSEQYHKPKTAEARHILWKLDENADEALVEKRRLEAEKIALMARKGHDFGKLAQRYSEGPSAKDGGRLPRFKREDMVKPFADKAFDMKENEISEPVRTRFGWHIIKVEKIHEASSTPLEAVKGDIAKKLSKEAAAAIAFEKAESLYNNLFDNDDLSKVAGERNLTLLKTGFFTQSDGPEKTGDAPTFAKAAFALKDGEISDVVEAGGGYFIMQVDERKPSRVKEFEKVKDEIRFKLLREKRDEMAEGDAKAMLAAVREGRDFGREARKHRVKAETTGLFKRSDKIPGIGFDRELSNAAFGLKKKGHVPEQPVKSQKGWYAARLAERRKPDAKGLETERPKLVRDILERKKKRLFQDWLTSVRQKSEIYVEKEWADIMGD